MEFRRLGRSGLTISEIAYGNWITHGSQVEEDAAVACIRAALDAGITTFDTADVYAETRAEAVLGRALKDQRRESIEVFTKVYFPTGPGHNDRGLGRKHILESIDNRCAGCRPTMWTCTRHTATTTARRWKRPWRRSPTWSAPARPSTSASRSGRRTSCAPDTAWPAS